MSFLQIRSTSISPRLSGPASTMFNSPSRDLMMRLSRPSIGCGNNESIHSELIGTQPLTSEHIDTHKSIPFPSKVSTIAVQ